ncbi:hypothetical protein GKZ68_05370 [Hymenobacter sp. BRD128]|uniref:hypothetical protein n=1 Tax=Hymenobacter sp. BRD128 TaxID=2675878 RepID=UPI0015646722|nr:hypothetical protein [Hymenobacter sp. BRD128]QKG56120.1 hypothetical protein GKZ68_05370 [Hymenobacter sp. BRD128]
MGLFDFLKNKPESAPATPPTPAPGAPPAGDAAAPAPKSGPRYQGSKYVAPAEPTPQIPPMPPMPQGQGPLAPPPVPEFPFEPQNVLEHLLLLAPWMRMPARPSTRRCCRSIF